MKTIKQINLKKVKAIADWMEEFGEFYSDVQEHYDAHKEIDIYQIEVKEQFGKGIAVPQATDKDIELPPVDEIIRLIKGTNIELPCLLAMWLSLRISEIRGLKFKDISEDGRYISVRRTKVYVNGKDCVREQTKTEKSKRINRLPGYIYDLIQQVPHTSDEDYIVPYGYQAISGPFKRLMKSIGYNDISFHKLRHEFATTLNELHIPDEYIQKLGGWSTDNVMKAVYTHTRKSKEDEYQEIIDNHFSDIINNN